MKEIEESFEILFKCPIQVYILYRMILFGQVERRGQPRGELPHEPQEALQEDWISPLRRARCVSWTWRGVIFYSFGVTDAFSRKDDSRADSCALTAPLIFCANIYIFSVMWHVLKLVAAM